MFGILQTATADSLLMMQGVDNVKEVVIPDQPKLSDEFAALLIDRSPLQKLHDVLSECLGESVVIKVIVSFVGYSESTIEEEKYNSGLACTEPDIKGYSTTFFCF